MEKAQFYNLKRAARIRTPRRGRGDEYASHLALLLTILRVVSVLIAGASVFFWVERCPAIHGAVLQYSALQVHQHQLQVMPEATCELQIPILLSRLG
jgi:hypothetical protein